MLIRTQNRKKLINLDNVALIYIFGEGLIKIAFNSEEEDDIIGEYHNEDKALKVLDMIQAAYTKCNQPNKDMYVKAVFQMPQESEV